MQTYFTGRFMNSDALTAEQRYVKAERQLQPQPPGSSQAQARAAQSLSEAVAMALPSSLLDRVALNPQPLPPRDSVDEAMVAPADEGDSLGAFEIQRLMSAYNEAETLASAVMKKTDDTHDDTVHKIG